LRQDLLPSQKGKPPVLVVEGNPERLAWVEFSAREGLVVETKSCAVKTTITTAWTKTAWSLNFNVNAFDFIDKVRITKDGRFQRFQRARGAISFFPSHQPFSNRLKAESGVFANLLVLALNPVFVSRVAEELELDADRIDLTEKRRIPAPTLRYIALALRAGVQTGAALDRMYGEALSTALAVHLLREYDAAVPGPNRQYGGLPRAKLARAVEYIQDQLDTDLTVSGFARAVGMRRNHLTRLFKESTGQSPYRYVVEARVRKAKELLTTGKFTISEAAHQVGFVDQSHLTRHFKRVFGLPPKRLLSR
jgi:AraC family transcriptional regulator